jgi:hypothetical protein
MRSEKATSVCMDSRVYNDVNGESNLLCVYSMIDEMATSACEYVSSVQLCHK